VRDLEFVSSNLGQMFDRIRRLKTFKNQKYINGFEAARY